MALPKFEDWKAPWEVDSAGNPIEPDKQETDPAKLKKHLWNVLSDKEKAQTARDAALAQVGTLTTERDTLKQAAEAKNQEGMSELQKLQQSIEGLTQRAEQAEFEKTKIQVLTTHKIKPEAHALLQGKTAAELEASAQQLVALGLVEEAKPAETGGGEGNGGGQGNPLDTKPTPRLNPGDPNPGGDGDADISVDDFTKRYGSSQFPL